METYEILRVDLSAGTAAREEVPPELVRSFLGGKALAAHYLAEELPRGADPLGPDNPLIFMAGPVTGLFPGTCRHVVVTKSPLTGGFLDTYAGGWFAWELRKAGLLGIIITGSAARLTYLEVTSTGAALNDAADLAGKSIADVDDDPRFAGARVCAIGPAGENQVLLAAIGNNLGATKNGRSGFNGRGGAGAVMGAKNLKAVVVRGSGRPRTSAAGQALAKQLSASIMEPGGFAGELARAGTPVIVGMINEIGIFPTENWHRGTFSGAGNVDAEAVVANLVAHEGCYNCPIRCGTRVRAPQHGPDGAALAFPGAETAKLEYETIGLAAANTRVADFSSIVHFSDLCDRLGLDTISTGAAVAFAMDCVQQGLIDLPVRFGDAAGLARLTEDIAYRRGAGAVLGSGVRSAAREWGVDPTRVPVAEIKGLELPAYDPRGSVGMALAYAMADRGACHMRSWPLSREALSSDPEANRFGAAGKAAMVVGDQDGIAPKWSMIFCDFVVQPPETAVQMLAAVGLDLTEAEYRAIGPRSWNLIRLINLREGWSAADDLPPAVLAQPLEESGWRLPPEVFAQMKAEYYELRGWDEEGRPTPELLARLGLEGYAAHLA